MYLFFSPLFLSKFLHNDILVHVAAIYGKKKAGNNFLRLYNFANKNKVEMNAGVTNAYNRENIFYFDRVRYERINQLPILPSLSVSYSF